MIGFREKKPKVLTIPINDRYRSHRFALKTIDQYSRENGIPVRQAVIAIINEYGKMMDIPDFLGQEENGHEYGENFPEGRAMKTESICDNGAETFQDMAGSGLEEKGEGKEQNLTNDALMEMIRKNYNN